MTVPTWTLTAGDDPLLATAIHAGHEVRREVGKLLKLSDADRLREEDPFTDLWVDIAENSIAVHRSRFEVDLNRPRDRAVYVRPEDAWGLEVWASEPSRSLIDGSLQVYDQFYRELGELCDDLVARHGRMVVLDLHSYNHRRSGPDGPVDDPEDNPEINLGTESIHPDWADVVSAFARTIGEVPFDDVTLDVRSNVKFRGGHMSRWLNDRYGSDGCSIAVEVKKIYMDEWTGEMLEGNTASVGRVLTAAADAVRELVRAG